jgi:hypothetical protein
VVPRAAPDRIDRCGGEGSVAIRQAGWEAGQRGGSSRRAPNESRIADRR